MPIDEDMFQELRKISKILIMSNGANLEKELSNYATNDDRKRIWALMDGNRQADDIVKATGLKKSAVYGFLKNLESAQLVERQHGKPPKRLLDYVPSSWVELIQVDSNQYGKEEPQITTQQPEQTIQEGTTNV